MSVRPRISALRLAAHILLHRPRRLLAGALAVAVAVIIMFMELGFFHGFTESQALLPPLFDADFVLMDVRREHLNNWTEMPALRLAQAAAVPGVAKVIPVYNAAMAWRHPVTRQVHGIDTFAFPPDSHALRVPGLAEFAPQLKVRGNVLFDTRSRALYGPVEIGTLVELEDRPALRVAGFFTMGPNFSQDGRLVMSEATYLESTHRQQGAPVDWGLIRLQPWADKEDVRKRLRAALPADTLALTPDEMHRREVAYTAREVPVGIVFGIAMAVGFIIGAVVCYQVLFNEITDHLPQFATLKAMGFGNEFLRRIVLHQAWILAVLGFVPGLIGGLLLCAELWRRTDIVMLQTPGRVALVGALTVAMCLVAGSLALRRAVEADAAEVFA